MMVTFTERKSNKHKENISLSASVTLKGKHSGVVMLHLVKTVKFHII